MTTQTAGVVPEFSIHDRLRKAREFSGLDQVQLADRIGVSRGTVSNVESGRVKRIRPILTRAWAMATGVDLTWLETGTASADLGPDGGTFTVLYRQPARVVSLRSSAA